MNIEIQNLLVGVRRWVNSKVSTLNTEISGKANSVHTHTIGDVANLQDDMDKKVDKVPPTPLCFTANTAGSTVGITNNGGNTPNIEISTDNGDTWTTWDYTTITLTNRDDSVLMRGNNQDGFSISNSKYSKFVMTGSISASGSVMSLIDHTQEKIEIPCDYCFNSLFQDCSSLTTSPELPAMNITGWCYQRMFRDCTSLTTSPELPATTLASNCYDGMFWGCSALTTAPKLPAKTLMNRCYQNMFYGCSALITPPALPSTTLAFGCYNYMFMSCTHLTTAPELPAKILERYCYSNMFYSCTALTKSPELPATTLVEGCYSSMFNGCRSLNYIKCLAVNGINQNNSTNSWVNGVAIYGYFEGDPNAEWTTDSNGIPTGWLNREPSEHEDEYLTFDIKTPGTVLWKKYSNSSVDKTIEYSISTDGGVTWSTWTSLAATTSGAEINVSANDKVRFKGPNTQYASARDNYCSFSGGTATFDIYGNIMSLINGDNFYGTETLTDEWTFTMLFKASGVISAENLVLPSRTLVDDCYRAMFSNATGLTKAPKLPATTLAKECYWYMFENTSITEAPELPAKTLVNGCYGNMFNGCASLNYIKCDAIYGLGASNALSSWVLGVSASGTFIKDPSPAWRTDNSGIPSGWTTIDTSYTDDSINNALAGKSNVGHTHTVSNITDLATTLADLLPIGSITLWPASTAPNTNWKICDGSDISRETYEALFDIIGTTYGAGDGSTTFNLPDLQGKFALGVSGTHALASTGGSETHTLDVTEIPSHNHEIKSLYHKAGTVSTSYRTFNLNSMGMSPDAGDIQDLNPTDYTENTGGGQAHNNMPPYLAMNYIIKVL